VSDWLREREVRAEAVHTGSRSADRDDVIEGLASGRLQVVVAVDLFNEGIDIPLIDRVVMLRPTQSPVVFLQQLGRGLRVAEGKTFLQVIDFVGNHKVFLQRVRTLLSLSPKPPSVRDFIGDPEALQLPEGCSVDIEFGAIELLSKLLPSGDRNETIRVYREIREARGTRPTPGELVRRGLNPASLRQRYEHWYGFVVDEGDASSTERDALVHDDWLRHLERTSMNKSFKMVVLEVLVQNDALFSGMTLDRLAIASYEFLLRNPELLADLEGVQALPDPGALAPARWRRYWNKNPIAAWTSGVQPWFVIEDGVFRFRRPPPAAAATSEALQRLTRHIVDWRLATYRRRNSATTDRAASFTCKLSWNR
jgi:hypothetical protein